MVCHLLISAIHTCEPGRLIGLCYTTICSVLGHWSGPGFDPPVWHEADNIIKRLPFTTFTSYILYMINIDWLYTTRVLNWTRWENDADGNSFQYYLCYWNRTLAKVYSIWDDETDWSILYINKNWNFKKYIVYWYFNTSAIQWFILWVLYNGERESNTTWDISNLPVQVQVWANA